MTPAPQNNLEVQHIDGVIVSITNNLAATTFVGTLTVRCGPTSGATAIAKVAIAVGPGLAAASPVPVGIGGLIGKPNTQMSAELTGQGSVTQAITLTGWRELQR